MKMKNGLIGLALVTGLVLAACNSGTDSAAPVAAGDLVGKWFYRHETTKGSIKSHYVLAGKAYDTTVVLDHDTAYTGTTYYMEFKADNTYSSNSPDDEVEMEKTSAVSSMETGTWSLSGATLTMISSDSNTAKINIAVSGTTLTGSVAFDSTATANTTTITTHMNSTLTLSK